MLNIVNNFIITVYVIRVIVNQLYGRNNQNEFEINTRTNKNEGFEVLVEPDVQEHVEEKVITPKNGFCMLFVIL